MKTGDKWIYTTPSGREIEEVVVEAHIKVAPNGMVGDFVKLQPVGAEQRRAHVMLCKDVAEADYYRRVED